MTHQKDQMPERERREAKDVEKFRVWAETATYQAARGHWSNVWTIIAAELQPIADRYGSGDAIRASNGEHGAPAPAVIPEQQLPARTDPWAMLAEAMEVIYFVDYVQVSEALGLTKPMGDARGDGEEWCDNVREALTAARLNGLRPEHEFKASRGNHPITPQMIDQQLSEHSADYEQLGREERLPKTTEDRKQQFRERQCEACEVGPGEPCQGDYPEKCPPPQPEQQLLPLCTDAPVIGKSKATTVVRASDGRYLGTFKAPLGNGGTQALIAALTPPLAQHGLPACTHLLMGWGQCVLGGEHAVHLCEAGIYWTTDSEGRSHEVRQEKSPTHPNSTCDEAGYFLPAEDDGTLLECPAKIKAWNEGYALGMQRREDEVKTEIVHKLRVMANDPDGMDAFMEYIGCAGAWPAFVEPYR